MSTFWSTWVIVLAVLTFGISFLLLRDRMQTATGRELAEERHRFLEEFLGRFLREWEGNG